MKRFNPLHTLILCLCSLVTVGFAAQDCMAQKAANSKTATQLEAVFKKHDEAFKQQDLKALMAIYAPGSNTVMMGTGPGERWQGKQEIEFAYNEMFKDFDKGSFSSNCYWHTGGLNGNMAWFAASCKAGDSFQNKPREYELNVTAIAEKVKGKWLFRSLHFSNLTGSGQ